jgi:hypothetical protein
MSSTIIDIERLVISLHGVSAQVAEAAATGLEAEIRRRLGALAVCEMTSLELGDLTMSPVHTETVLDASAVRGIIADRLVAAIVQPSRPSGIDDEGS